jgi:hypothetical protein
MDEVEEFWPSSPYSPSEQQRIMRDLQRSRTNAFLEDDNERMRNLKEIEYERGF